MATSEPTFAVRRVISKDQIIQARRIINAIHMDEKVRDYVVDLVLATRPPIAATLRSERLYSKRRLTPRHDQPMSGRAGHTAFMNGRHFVTPQDVKSVALDVLRHRVIVSYEAEAENVTADDVVLKILDTLPVP